MYKLLIFLKKTDNKEMADIFNDITLKQLSAVSGSEVQAADVESNLLTEQKYVKYCEVVLSSKDEWDKKMNSREGKELNKHLMNIHQFIDIIFINYPDKR